MKNEKKKERQEKNLKPPNETSFTLVDPMHQLASTPLFDVNFPIYFIAREHKKQEERDKSKTKRDHSLGDISYTTWSI